MAQNGTIAYVDAPKPCDFHKRMVQETIAMKQLPEAEAKQLLEGVPEATFDAKTRHGFWANMCDSCASEHSLYPGLLGVGRGQRLEVRHTP
jgi:hypothetical protein